MERMQGKIWNSPPTTSSLLVPRAKNLLQSLKYHLTFAVSLGHKENHLSSDSLSLKYTFFQGSTLYLVIVVNCFP